MQHWQYPALKIIAFHFKSWVVQSNLTNSNIDNSETSVIQILLPVLSKSLFFLCFVPLANSFFFFFRDIKKAMKKIRKILKCKKISECELSHIKFWKSLENPKNFCCRRGSNKNQNLNNSKTLFIQIFKLVSSSSN